MTSYRTQRLVACGALAGILAIAGTPMATAGETTSSHGVRVHKLMTPSATRTAEKRPQIDEDHDDAGYDDHPRVLRPSRTIIVEFDDVTKDTPYRRANPGVVRPWRERVRNRRRAFMNPPGLYRSQLYAPGKW